jgi:hypothetical protein
MHCADTTGILYWSAGIAVVAVVSCASLLRAQFDLFGAIPGTGTLDLKTSWVSNTTILSAFLVSVIKDVKLVPPLLTGANLFFPVLAVVAYVVLMATAFGWKEAAYKTPTLAYLAAVVVALTAALGQLFTLSCVVRFASETHTDVATMKPVAAIFTPELASVFVATLFVAGALIILYTCLLMSRHLKKPPAAEVNAQPRKFAFL